MFVAKIDNKVEKDKRPENLQVNYKNLNFWVGVASYLKNLKKSDQIYIL